MRKMKLASLVFDFDLYPRRQIDTQHVHYMGMALDAGTDFPPILIDKASKRIVDGFHRARMFAKKLGPKASVQVIEKSYRSEADMFLDAVRHNASHGRMLAPFDRTHCVLRAEALEIEPEQIASAMQITADVVGKLRADRVGKLHGAVTPLKRTIRHMAGRSLTQAQEDAHRKLGGMNQAFYANQLIVLIESGLLDKANEQLMASLAKLKDLLDHVLAAAIT